MRFKFQLAAFRNIRSSEGTKLTHNIRPVQPLADRVVYHNIYNNKDNGGLSIRSDATMLILIVVSTLLATI